MYANSIERKLSALVMAASFALVLIVLSGYFAAALHASRGPSPIYFCAALMCYLTSARFALMLAIFLFPLLPNLINQASLVLHPSVPYFITHASVDITVGLYVGYLLKKVSARTTYSDNRFPWPVGAAVMLICISTAIAITRNLRQMHLQFHFEDLFFSFIRFKHLTSGSDYLPIADLIVYIGAITFFSVLLNTLKQEEEKDSILFKPLILALIVSSLWGIFQATTGFGLGANTNGYRPEWIGFGANGFQLDIHSFAAHMLVGAVGLFEYIRTKKLTSLSFYLTVLAIILSWIALILSKSRASVVLAVSSLILYYFFILIKNSHVLAKIFKWLFSAGLILCLISIFTMDFDWLATSLRTLSHSNPEGFSALNELSSKRLEIFRAVLLMFEQFPLGGVGQGNLLRLSKMSNYSQSPYMIEAGGENAHNYFLQTLVELGIIGILVFISVFMWPVHKAGGYLVRLTPAILCIFSMFLGNLYSHSLIIRENLFFLAAMVALLYAQSMSPTCRFNVVRSCASTSHQKTISSFLLLLVSALLIGWAYEFYQSLFIFPFFTE